MYKKIFSLLMLALITAISGYFFNQPNTPLSTKKETQRKKKILTTPQYILTDISPALTSPAETAVNNTSSRKKIAVAADKDEVIGDKVLTFENAADMQEFIKKAAQYGFYIRDRIPSLNSLRVYFPDKKSLARLLSDHPEIDLISDNPAVLTPAPLLQSSGKGLNQSPRNFLGVKDNSNWGDGITVAVIDSGITDHNALQGNIQHIDLVNDDSEILSSHGTSVASLIAGDSDYVQGVSPAVNLLDIRALNNDGVGDSFTVAKAIIAAADAGANIINLSLGSFSDSPVLEAAVAYALQKNIILVAAVGNDGQGQVSYPAKYPGVIGVGAVDANANYLSFSNRGEEVDIMAPGLQLYASGLDDSVISFSGTSAATPLVAATLAYQLSQNPQMSNQEVIDQVYNSANEAGAPGNDGVYGGGILNVGRLENNQNDSVIDVAASGFYLSPIPDSDKLQLFFTGENRGNLTLNEVQIQISFADYEKVFYFNDIKESESFYDSVIIERDSPVITNSQPIVIEVKSPYADSNSANDKKGVTININPTE